MIFDEFIKEVMSIENPKDKGAYMSKLVDERMTKFEEDYTMRSIEYLARLKVEVKSQDLSLLAKSLKLLANNQYRLLMILDSLAEL